MIGYWMSVLISSWGPPNETKVRYSDGREEIIITPVTFEVGTIITVVKKKDGSAVVALVE